LPTLVLRLKKTVFYKTVISAKNQKDCPVKTDKKIVLSADLGGTNLRMAAVDCNGKILHRTKLRTPKTNESASIVQVIVESAIECRQKSHGEVFAIAAAVPGTVDIKKGVIVTAPNLSALNGLQISKVLEKKLNLPCLLENDANAAAIGENWLGASKSFQDSIFVTLGTGIGGGIIINGKVLRGIDGTAGEIGHLCVEPNGAECGCGSRGCVEQYSSATAVVRLARELSKQFPKSNLNIDPTVTSLEIYGAAKAGDKLALEVFRQQGFYLGIALAGLIDILNPEIIVVGGGAAAAWDLFMPHTVEQIHKRAYQVPAKRAKIVRARLGDDAGILGAARLAFD